MAVEAPKRGGAVGNLVSDRGDFWEIWGFDWKNPQHGGFNILRCKNCGYEILVQVAGNYMPGQGGPALWEARASADIANHRLACLARAKERIRGVREPMITGAKKSFVPR